VCVRARVCARVCARACVCACACVRARVCVALLTIWQKESVVPIGQEAAWFSMLFLPWYDNKGIHVQITACPAVLITYLSHLADIQ
jgi:hypothetical protein